MVLAAVIPLFPVVHSIHPEILGDRHGLELHTVGISDGEAGSVRYFRNIRRYIAGFNHLLANTIPLFFLTWCLFYFLSPHCSLYIFSFGLAAACSHS